MDKMAAYGGQKNFEQKRLCFSPFLPSGDILCPKKSVKGSSHHLELLAWWKRVAVDPHKQATSQDSIEKQFKQALRIRRNLFSRCNEYKQKKRKLEKLVRGDNLTASGMDLRKYDSHNVKTLVMEQSDAASCITNLTDTTKSLSMQQACNSRSLSIGLNSYQQKQELSDSSKRNNSENPSLSSDNVGSIIRTDVKIVLSNQDSLEALDAEFANSMNIADLVDSESSSSKEPKGTRRLAFSLLMLKGECLPRPEVPVGSGFQAEIPDLMDACTARNHYTSEDASGSTRWLGFQVSLVEGRSRSTQKFLEKAD